MYVRQLVPTTVRGGGVWRFQLRTRRSAVQDKYGPAKSSTRQVKISQSCSHQHTLFSRICFSDSDLQSVEQAPGQARSSRRAIHFFWRFPIFSRSMAPLVFLDGFSVTSSTIWGLQTLIIIYAFWFRIQGDTFAQAITLPSQVIATCSGSAFPSSCWSLFQKELVWFSIFQTSKLIGQGIDDREKSTSMAHLHATKGI